MNILYLNHYAGSPALGMEYRPYYLAREWVRAGHRVQMVAADHSHVRTRQPRAGDELIDGIVYHWVATPPYRGNGPQRARNIAVFLSRVWRDTPRLLQRFRPDVVIASSTYPMDIWVAHRIVRLARRQGIPCKLVFEVHDLWPLSPIELGGMSRWHPFILWMQHAENRACRDADVVVSMLPKADVHLREHGMAAAMNGIALSGSFIPYGATFMVFTDYCRPSIRLSALMQQRVIYVMTHDSIGVGEDGPTHQPIEHLAALRAIPNLQVLRPADALEDDLIEIGQGQVVVNDEHRIGHSTRAPLQGRRLN